MTELPTAFGKYFLTEKLAAGGMAEIYLGKLLGPGGFEKLVVIKQIHPRLSGQRQFVDLFVAEAKTLVSLAHGNIVPVYELGVIDDTYFIAMDYIDGPTLYRFTEALARRGERMEPAVAAWITARILEGLDYAHRKGDGVIHRDLSPRNVMLSRDGEIKLVDFGIAVTLGAAGEEPSQSAPTGSFPYMSPEQVRREQLTAQTDLFSAGVLVWEMLVGQRLFARPDADATLRAVTDDEIPLPSSVSPAVPERLDRVVMRALARDRTERWPSAREMLQELQRYLYSLDAPPGPGDVAALVARYCPPETRRLPTHADLAGGADTDPAAADAAAAGIDPAAPLGAAGGPRTARIERGGPAARPGTARIERGEPPDRPHTVRIERDGRHTDARPGTVPIERDEPHTAAVERDGSPEEPPAGKRRPRTETFATHVAFKDMLERATPLFPMPALTDEIIAERAASAAAARPAGAPRAARSTDAPDEAAPDGGAADGDPDVISLPVPGRTPPSGGLLVLLALGTLALGAAAVFAFMRGRGRFERGPSLIRPGASDAGLLAPPGLTDAAPTPLVDAPDAPHTPAATDAPLVPVPAPTDAGPRPARLDAAPSPALGLHDAAVLPDAAARPAGDATLVIGANPWGDIYIDGARKGRTPTTLVIPAGKHAIEVIFGGEDPPRTRRFSIDLRAGETQQLDADFTRP